MRQAERLLGIPDMIRLSLGGAIFASALSGTLGYFGGWGSSGNRDVIWSLVGFLIVFVILLLDRSKTKKRAIGELAQANEPP